MSLPVDSGSLMFYSQRVDGAPYVNCLPYSVTMALRYCGYECPTTYGMTIRKASGVPVKDGVGTGFSDMKKALHVLLPDAPALWTALADDALIAALPAGPSSGYAVAMQFYMPRLPDHVRRWCGKDWVGWHGMCVAGYLPDLTGVPDAVWLMDPMGKSSTGYAGEWVSWWDLAPGVRRKALAATGSGRDAAHPLFSKEGPSFYTAAYSHNKAFASDTTSGKGPYQTHLASGDETSFKHWVSSARVPFNTAATKVDYDMRGYWLDTIKPGGTWQGGHFPDTYKTPYDTTFSQESRYATGDCPFYWDGNTLKDSRHADGVAGAFVFADPPVQNVRFLYGAAA